MRELVAEMSETWPEGVSVDLTFDATGLEADTLYYDLPMQSGESKGNLSNNPD